MPSNAHFAIVTGASTGIGLELAKRCAEEGFDLLIAADEPEIDGLWEVRSMLSRRTWQRRKASTNFTQQPKAGRSMHCWRTPGAALATLFSIRISARYAR
jgi:NAD(P)-dependent dehydrogenase (short-subunit alcohol dehydrogenase family)